MRKGSPLEIGVLYLVAALGLSIAQVPLLYGVFALFESSIASSGPFSAYNVHVFWLPWIGVAFGAAVAVLGGLGYLPIRRTPPTFQSSREAKLRLGGLAFLASGAAFVIYTFIGVVMALTYAPTLARVHTVVYILFTIGIGFFLYWTLVGIGPRLASLAGIAALVLGITGTVLVDGPRVAPGGTGWSSLDGLGTAFAYASLAIWLGAYLWSYSKLRAGRISHPSVALAA